MRRNKQPRGTAQQCKRRFLCSEQSSPAAFLVKYCYNNQPPLCPASPQHHVGTLATDITSQLVLGTNFSALQILLTDRTRSSCISCIYLLRSLSRSSVSPSQQGRQTKAVCAWKQQPFHGSGEMDAYPLQKEGSPGTWPPLLSLSHQLCI